MTDEYQPWLDIDLDGFAKSLNSKGLAQILYEPLSNALDTEAKIIRLAFSQANGRAHLTVSDDDPDGFANLADAWTLYAESTRANDPSKRGRYGQGEKELIAMVCARSRGGGTITLSSTTGTVEWSAEGRRHSDDRREAGSQVVCDFRCNQRQAAEFRKMVESLIVPADRTVLVSFDHDRALPLTARTPVRTFRASLPTVKADEDGNLIDTTRVTDVVLYEPAPGGKPRIFELGVPVVEHNGRYDADVQQKVPLGRDRNNVTPGYLRNLTIGIVNSSYFDLTEVDWKRGQIRDVLALSCDEAVRAHVRRIHGPDAVIFDPGAPESVKRATDQGRTLVYGRSYTADEWKRIKGGDDPILVGAGKAIPTGVPSSPDGTPPIPRAEWTEAMFHLAAYVKAAGEVALGYTPTVQFTDVNTTTGGCGSAIAWFGGGTVTFNFRYLGKRWPEKVGQEELDALLIHEFAHDKASDHLHESFYRETCRIGARLRAGFDQVWVPLSRAA